MGLFSFLNKNKKDTPNNILDTPLEDDILPGEIVLLYWLNKNSESKRIPVYFNYDYHLNFETSKQKLISKDYIDSNVLKLTDKGSNLLDKYKDIIWAHKNNSKDGIINVESVLQKGIEEVKKEFEYSRRPDVISNKMLQQLKDMKVNYYQVNCTLDKSTCEKCAKMDGKVFLVSEAKIGVNFPLFHEDCRCTALPHVVGRESISRWQRDPVTGKGSIEKYQTYQEWKQAMIDKYGEDVFDKNK